MHRSGLARTDQVQIAAILDLFIALSMLFVLLRVYVKIYLSKQWNTDDTLLVLAQVRLNKQSKVAIRK